MTGNDVAAGCRPAVLTLVEYVAHLGGRLRLVVDLPNGEIELIVLALGCASTFSDERIPELGELLRQVANEVMTDAGVPVRKA